MHEVRYRMNDVRYRMYDVRYRMYDVCYGMFVAQIRNYAIRFISISINISFSYDICNHNTCS